MYLALLGKNFVNIWNIQSRTIVNNYEVCAGGYWGNKSLNGTSDSKSIFF
jgi:ABC-type enterochelin transport system permease subunit